MTTQDRAHPVVERDRVYREIEGLYLSYYLPDKSVLSALAYKPKPGDVFVVSYPKCGTTWMQFILFNIFSGGVPPKSKAEFRLKTPFLECTGVECVARMPGPGAIKTHFPFHKQPYSRDAKYFYITRNPYDCCVSYYHQKKILPAYFFEDGTFDEFFETFVEGKGEYGDYFDHLLSWYEHRDDPNVFFLTYEDLKRDTRSWIVKMADFIGKEYGERMRADPGLVELIRKMSSIEHMKNVLNDALKTPSQDVLLPSDETPEKLSFEEFMQYMVNKPMTGDFVRKGVVGDWKSYFSQAQVRRMKDRIALKTAGSDVMALWKDVDLP
ncbi:hypothetical protein HPB47_011956 [Ixodes persulcatus]|uniref:Uncharacterized protein n=1 Tax=Ixodes persulcatus TaxID=34615 RepID=A0AC60NV23_IXOPE|nr:hypothetical protein HPB47_011956 [Ixodes persulcatus]